MKFETFKQVYKGLHSLESLKDEIGYNPDSWFHFDSDLDRVCVDEDSRPHEVEIIGGALKAILIDAYFEEGWKEVKESMYFRRLDREERTDYMKRYKNRPLTIVRDLWKNLEVLRKEGPKKKPKKEVYKISQGGIKNILSIIIPQD